MFYSRLTEEKKASTSQKGENGLGTDLNLKGKVKRKGLSLKQKRSDAKKGLITTSPAHKQ